MKIIHYDEVELEPVTAEGAEKAQIRWLIAQKDGAPTFAMRMFEIEPGGHTPHHQHKWEHEVYCLSGKGALVTDRGEMAFGADDAIFVDPDILHSFKNTRNETLKFLCLIPHEKPIIKKALNPFADEEANNC